VPDGGFDDLTPRLAVVVQQQIESVVAGVAFSLNPVTNDYDETVIDASWGLGPSVVDGRVSPDHFVVNTVDRTVVEAMIGPKGVSVWLDPEGGTVEQEELRAEEQTLGTTHLQELTNMLARIEALFEHPVDVEWAYADDQLHVLVAVTTDPGWTPLFVNAAAIVLEVGGTLQHGAVVAREYGKPCVVGLDRATTLLDDGQQVEVDGARGTVRLLDA